MVKKDSRKKLKALLFKFGIKSAGILTFQEVMDDIVETMNHGIGSADDVFMSDDTFEKFIKQFVEKKK